MTKTMMALLALAVFSGQAEAHAFFESAVPAVGSTVATAPTEVSVTFGQAVEPSFSRIEVTDAKGVRVDKSDPHTAASAETLVVSLKPLSPGDYKVVWHVTSVDTHKTQGSFGFTVRP